MENEQMVLDNMNLAWYTARKFDNCGIEMDDLVSICMLGLCKAAATYDGRKAKFSTYAVTVMKNKVLHAISKEKKHNTHYAMSLDEEVFDGTPLSDTIPDSRTVWDDSAPDAAELYRSWMRILTNKERQVVRMIVVNEMKQVEVAHKFKHNPSYINKIYKRAIQKAREHPEYFEM